MNIIFELSDVKTVGIAGHVRPDGDCVGSVMGLYDYIRHNLPEIEIDAYLETPGKEFGYIHNIDRLKNEPDLSKRYDLFFVLDCSDLERIKPFIQCYKNAKRTICIDHHASNISFADKNFIFPEASSTCEVLYNTLDEDKITKDVAECLYTGIVHDTGVFKYSCTSQDTMAIAGKLMAKGIPYSDIIDNSFYKKTYVQNLVLGRALLDCVLFNEARCIYSVLYRKDLEFYGVEGKDLSGIIEQLRLTEGVEVAIFLYETGENEYKVSLRSKNYIDVSRIAVHFGGGGHVRAAGVTMEGSVNEILGRIEEQLQMQFADR